MDAAWSKETGAAGLGWIFDPGHPDITICQSKSIISVSSSLMAEALAILGAIFSAKQRLLSKVWFRSDSQRLIQAINLKFSVELYGVPLISNFYSRISVSLCFLSFLELENMMATENMMAGGFSGGCNLYLLVLDFSFY
ncbi:hypothetical protein YC2023_087085 [Brassica napus]|uniref:(rape) hypothetical protein n=1 Tax=Brassica napus TaxID=3708 RepID=A0A816N6Q9_BRANA|nr:unnamed protein product [Brassica napus]